jgi:amidase
MSTESSGWKASAKSKRDAILNSIPEKWRIKGVIPSVAEQRDVTGDYIWQYLSKPEIEITETDATGIVKNIASGQWTATEVTEAFCHRASLAHQLVHRDLFVAQICGRTAESKL